MKIKIENYNNIGQLDYEIVDNKINFLFGISGSGKSSIANALSNDVNETHVPYGTEIQPTTNINGLEINYDDFRVFNVDYMNNILIEKSEKEAVYNIILGDNNNIQELKDEYLEAIKCLMNVKDYVYANAGKIQKLTNDLKISYQKDGHSYHSTCLVGKMTNNISKEKYVYVRNKKMSSIQIKWYSDGKNFEQYKEGKCPFCNKKLSNSRKKIIDKIVFFDAKTYEKINSCSGIFSELEIKEPNWTNKRDVYTFNKSLHDYYSVLPELNKIIDYIKAADNIEITMDNLETIKVSNELKKLFPSVSDSIIEFNSVYSSVKNKLIKIKKETNKMIASHIREINDYLSLLGIQYMFCHRNIDSNTKKADFIIKSVKDRDEIDRVVNLSYGEKNIIGLILFLFANRERKCLIIDDPASSYDEYRRKVIFDALYRIKGKNSTYLVLSHDHVFAKYAAYHFEKSKTANSKDITNKTYRENTGKINYLESYDRVIIKEVDSTQFKSITEFIRDKIMCLNAMMDYQMAINLRLYYEINKASKYHKEVYGYLSAILHKLPYDVIMNYLHEKGKEENEILEIISNDMRTSIKELSPTYLDDINIDYYTDFEKIIYAREQCKKSRKGKIIKDELSNIVHMNQAYAICLNPYEYNYFSKYVYDYLESDLSIKL